MSLVGYGESFAGIFPKNRLSPMMTLEVNVERNKEHYDNLYSRVDLEVLRHKIQNYEDFLAVATETDAGWVGLYHGGFKEKLNERKVLELGCGKGLNALIMAVLGAEVVAIDISEESSQVINRLSQELGLSSRVEAYSGDFRHLSFPPRSFDFVVGQAFLHHLVHELEDVALCQISQILKTHGEARFVEPAVNSKFLDQIRWLVPVPGRPSASFRARGASDGCSPQLLSTSVRRPSYPKSSGSTTPLPTT